MRKHGTLLVMVMATGRICLANPLPISGPQAQGRNDVVVSDSTDSAVAGLEMLRQGGNAADAAVAF
jgi:gamma-glutamyltranspeptidase